jgi:hypothetical protein
MRTPRSKAYSVACPPKFVRPCIPTTAKAIPRGDAWLHEPKLDGYRFQDRQGRPPCAAAAPSIFATCPIANVAVFGLVPIPPMPDTLSTWSTPSKLVAKLREEIERHGLETLFRSARRLLPARDQTAIG